MFDWNQYLELARRLAAQADEAGLRSAISRAYYSAFCLARNRLRAEGVVLDPSAGSHAAVWNAYRNSPDLLRKRLGEIGNRCKYARKKADYCDTVTGLSQLAYGTVRQVEQVVSILKRL